MSISVKKGDAVKIIAGNDNGKSGTVLSVDPSKGKVVVQGDGLSTQTHFVKPRNAQEKGGLVKKERAINVSNVMIICPACNQPTRVAHKIEKNEEGKTVKSRICKKCGASLDEVKASKAKAAAKKAAPKKTAKKATKKTEAEDKE